MWPAVDGAARARRLGAGRRAARRVRSTRRTRSCSRCWPRSARWRCWSWRPFDHVTPLAVGLAAGALVLASLRAALTYLENVRMLRRSAREALTDSLSGLANRRALMDDLDGRSSRPATGHASTLVFFDLNGFKRYNDSFGHAAGDALLARIGAALSRAVGEPRPRLPAGRRRVLRAARRAARAARPGDRRRRRRAGRAGQRVHRRAPSVGMAVVPDDASTPERRAAARRRADVRRQGRRSGSRGQARDVLMQLLSERTPGLHEHVTSVGALASGVGDATSGWTPSSSTSCCAPPSCTTSASWRSPTRSSTSPARSTTPSGSSCASTPVIGERILSAAPALCAGGRAGARQPRALGRQRLSRRSGRRARSRSAPGSSPSATPSRR